MAKDDEFVVHGAKIKCSMGSKSSTLSVSSQSTYKIQGKKAATMMDFAPGTNLMPPLATFGTCKPFQSAPPPAQLCTPIPTGPWQKAFSKKKINGMAILKGDACLMCGRAGGLIEFENSGQ
jgi:uncharacterized Zn-binding protein involved in type VI secretion